MQPALPCCRWKGDSSQWWVFWLHLGSPHVAQHEEVTPLNGTLPDTPSLCAAGPCCICCKEGIELDVSPDEWAPGHKRSFGNEEWQVQTVLEWGDGKRGVLHCNGKLN